MGHPWWRVRMDRGESRVSILRQSRRDIVDTAMELAGIVDRMYDDPDDEDNRSEAYDVADTLAEAVSDLQAFIDHLDAGGEVLR